MIEKNVDLEYIYEIEMNSFSHWKSLLIEIRTMSKETKNNSKINT